MIDIAEDEQQPQPENIKVTDIDYNGLTAEDLLSEELHSLLYSIEDQNKASIAYVNCGYRASELKIKRAFDKGYKNYLKKIAKEQIASGTAGNITAFWGQPYTLRCGSWDCDDTGVSRIKQDSEGKCTIEKASPIPIIVTEVLTNISTHTEKVKLEFYKNLKWRSTITDRANISNVNKIIDLSNFGIEVTSESAKFLVKFLSELINLNRDVIPQVQAASRLGWVDSKTFIPYADNIKFDGDNNFLNLFESVSSVGSLEIWQSMTAELRKNIYIRLTMAAAFASPIIQLLDTLPFMLHLWGQTESGKTVSLKVAASIWGNPQPGRYLKNLNMTQNAMLSTAAFLKNLPFVCDELQSIKNAWDNFDKLIYAFNLGEGRSLNHYNKTLEALSWQNCLFTSGEEPIIKANSGGGAANRVIQMYVDKTIFTDNAAAVIECINNNYGAAGRKYITALINTDTAELKRTYNEYYKEIVGMRYTTDKQAASMAIILTGDSIASKLLYPGEKPLTAADIKQFLISAAEVDISERAYNFVINHIAANNNRFVTGELNHGETWGSITGSIASINKGILTRELNNAGYDFNAIKKKWADSKHIILSSTQRYYHIIMCNGITADYVKIILTIGELIDTLSNEDIIYDDLP